MKKYNLIIFGFLICILFSGCNSQKESEDVYNQKANEIIIQIIKESSCNCLLEIPKESLIETSIAENPSFDIRSFLISELRTDNNTNLDSLASFSKFFRLNLKALEKNNIKIVTLENLKSVKNGKGNEILKMCSKGIICIRKPIFDKTFQRAVIDYSFALTCGRVLPFPIYEFKNQKWNRVERKNYR
ncbi:hypothetical protein [Flavobacterium aquicola]|uniref:Lipoprotein n=1 Tax=Flavobacterium aquicola TaxID=1682742 RepID=A0A3E0DVA5_9FLAO|nr:hypothetical protein [Flavobacterium aquicola]REG88538.1 hypothetical protein C8P67_1373 [Flavobacterium aquicola]